MLEYCNVDSCLASPPLLSPTASVLSDPANAIVTGNGHSRRSHTYHTFHCHSSTRHVLEDLDDHTVRVKLRNARLYRRERDKEGDGCIEEAIEQTGL